ncbi:head-tail adaptor protein [Roseibium sp.]|uniref:head-tail adaptor protein n=1 Tax=Roseibium sp. TaxID=1936156 RepID=UPI003A985353
MSAGRYRTPIELEQPVVTHAADGAASLVYLAAGSDFAAIRTLRQREDLRGERLEGVVTHEIRLRYRDDVIGGWRMSAGLRRYRVLSAAPRDDRGAELFCLAEEEGT